MTDLLDTRDSTQAPGAPALHWGLTETESAIYRLAVLESNVHPERPPVQFEASATEWAQGCEDLVKRGVLSRHHGGALTPVHPDIASGILNGPLEDEIWARQRAIESNGRMLEAIAKNLAQQVDRDLSVEGVRLVAGKREVRQELDSAILRSTTEIVAMHPGGLRTRDHFGAYIFSESSPLRRDVSCLLLYQHTARANLGLESRARAVAENGGAIRTTSAGFERLIIFDHRIAFIPTDCGSTETEGAVVITQKSIVAFLYRIFEHLWVNAAPLKDGGHQAEEISFDIKMAILRLMASGLKDEAIAGRLGMAIRTCRRHISALMNDLGVTSRFQAGIRIAQLGLLNDVDTVSGTTDRMDANPIW